mgnify:CR=1 FL=1
MRWTWPRPTRPNDALTLTVEVLEIMPSRSRPDRGMIRTRSQTRNRINVNASPYFATRYLLDRINRFRDIAPDADLRLTTMVDLPDFVADDVDVAAEITVGQNNSADSGAAMKTAPPQSLRLDILRVTIFLRFLQDAKKTH